LILKARYDTMCLQGIKNLFERKTKHMATTTFDKRIIIDKKAAQRLINANEVSGSSLKNADKNKINNTSELLEWLSNLKK
jgi:hypothetical protein